MYLPVSLRNKNIAVNFAYVILNKNMIVLFTACWRVVHVAYASKWLAAYQYSHQARIYRGHVLPYLLRHGFVSQAPQFDLLKHYYKDKQRKVFFFSQYGVQKHMIHVKENL